MDGRMGFLSYIAQVWLEVTYDVTPMWCMLSLCSGYSFFPWHGWFKMIVAYPYEVGLLVRPKVDERSKVTSSCT